MGRAGLHLDRRCDANTLQPLAVDQHIIDRQQQAAADQERRRGDLCTGAERVPITSPSRYFLNP